MASNPYATPESDVTNHSDQVVKISPFTKKGRLSIMSYFSHSMILTLVALLLSVAVFGINAVVSGSGFGIESLQTPTPILVGGIGIIIILMSWVGICQAIKRLHDINFNGWWVLTMFILIGFILLIIPGRERSNRFGGWRQTRVWEKVAGALYILLSLAAIALPPLSAIMQ